MQVTRYGNRKYYSPESRSYITLMQLFERFLANEEIVVSDHRTRRNITEDVKFKAFVTAMEKGRIRRDHIYSV